MRKLILHLGGAIERANKCIQLANENPDALILVSSEIVDPIPYYTKRGIDPKRVFVDNTAWDTVTNFTHTYDIIKKEFRPEKIFVVTYDFHMDRAKNIANAIYWMRNVKLVFCPAGGPNPYGPKYNFTEPPRMIVEDTIRAWIYRLTGILFYYEKVRKDREKMWKSPKKWNEIGL
jgi:uncharacterized SAM-binding protein YcdF (DUF218 family)